LALLVVPALIAAIVIGGSALGASRSLTLKVKGQYAKHLRTACGKHKNFRFFHRHSTIEARGFLTPHPADHFPVSLQIRRCVPGQPPHRYSSSELLPSPSPLPWAGRSRSASSSANPSDEPGLPMSSRSERSGSIPPPNPCSVSPSVRPSSAARSS